MTKNGNYEGIVRIDQAVVPPTLFAAFILSSYFEGGELSDIEE
jgi:hypothetical protein